jgi:hypothetical protein
VCLACGSAAERPIARNATANHDVELAVAHGSEVRVYHVVAHGLELERTVKLPSTVSALAWVGDEPVVMLEVTPYIDEEGDPKYDGTVGRIGKTFEPFPAVDAKMWAAKAPSEDPSMYSHEPGRYGWRMVVTDSGEVWLGRSEWYFVPDAGGWTNFVYARLEPGPVTASQTEPTGARDYDLPKLDAPAGVTAELVPGPPKEAEGTIVPDNLLQCTIGGTATLLPPEDDRVELFNVDNLRWLVLDPPMFRVEEVRAGMTAVIVPVIYSGCTKTDLPGPVTAGPQGMYAIDGPELQIVDRGRVIGKIPPGQVVFRR